jgi:GNAT superfamily N-acetyltransferase
MSNTLNNSAAAYYRVVPANENEGGWVSTVVSFSANVRRVDFGLNMFRIEVSAEVIFGPEDLANKVGRLVAYRQHVPFLEDILEEGVVDVLFDPFDEISSDACAAFEDLIEVQGMVYDHTVSLLDDSPIDNLIYVDKISVLKEFRGLGIARAMMAELHDLMTGVSSVVFFQAIPFTSEVSAPAESHAWERERERGTAAMAQHWISDADLGFYQPDPTETPQILIAAWDGESLDEMGERSVFFGVEKIEPEETSKDIKPENVFAEIVADTRTAELDELRLMDPYDLTPSEICELAQADLASCASYNEADVEQIAAVGCTAYVAVRDGTEVCGIVMTLRETESGDIRFRAIEEDFGPFACEAPLSLLAKLSPAKSDMAQQWRKDCWRAAQSVREAV